MGGCVSSVLDEATSALDVPSETRLYSVCKRLEITVVSVGHRESLVKVRTRFLHQSELATPALFLGLLKGLGACAFFGLEIVIVQIISAWQTDLISCNQHSFMFSFSSPFFFF